MAWTSTIRLDPDKLDVGSASMEWTEDDAVNHAALVGEKMSYGRRVRITSAERDTFITEAIAARDAWRVRRTDEKSYETNLNNRVVQLEV